jgi:phage/plasmid-like protein (TIGR03299 family)
MAHELEYRKDRNTWSFAFIGERSAIWHKRGQEASESWTLDQWKIGANQDFRVRKVPLAGIPDRSDLIPCETHELLIREDSGMPLSVVSRDWQPAQNDDAYAFSAPFIEAGFATMNTAGTLFDGRRCFVLLKTKEGFSLPGGDDTEGYILVQISHEYGIADLVLPTYVRVVCNNTLQAALRGKSKTQMDAGKFVHTDKGSFSVEKANALIEAYRLGLGEYAEKAKFLSTKRATPEQTRAYINRVFKLDDLKVGTATEIARRREHNARVVAKLLRTVETQPGANLSPGTWWSAFHAVTYHEDHGRWAGKDEPIAAKFQGTHAERKSTAFRVALEMAS